MAADPKKLGDETRSSILPTASPSNDFLGPNYVFADALPMPHEVGVKRDDSLTSVINAARGVAYYSDMIGYGAPSSALTSTLKEKPAPLGINYFIRTATKCSNGADMWIYVNGIPKGDAFGERIQKAMAGMNMPPLRGLAPGMMEDVKAGLDPRAVTNAIFGSGYTRCKLARLPVGDAKGRLQGPDGVVWIQPLSSTDIDRKDGIPKQSRWVFDSWLTQQEYQKEYDQRTLCPDGSLIMNHEGQDCAKPILPPPPPSRGRREGFLDSSDTLEVLLPVALLLSVTACVYMRYRN